MLNDILKVQVEYTPLDPVVADTLATDLAAALQEFEGLPSTEETRLLIAKRIKQVELDYAEELAPVFKTSCEAVTDEA